MDLEKSCMTKSTGKAKLAYSETNCLLSLDGQCAENIL